MIKTLKNKLIEKMINNTYIHMNVIWAVLRKCSKKEMEAYIKDFYKEEK